MKKNFVLRSLLAIMLLFVGLNTAWAEEITTKYSFSSYAAGTQYAQGEEHKLDDNVTLIINGAHLNTQVRLYAGSNAVFKVNGSVTKLVVSAGNKVGTLTIKGSNDGATWTEIKSISTKTSYTEYAFEIPNYSYVQMASTGAQIRVSIATLTYTTGEGGGDTPEPVDVVEPTFTPVDGTTFDESLDVTINVEDGLTAYYSLLILGSAATSVEDGEYTSGNTVNITETTTVYAYAQDAEGNKSDVASATYTKTEPLPEGAIAGAVVFKASGATYSGSISTVVDITGTNEQEIVGIEYASADVSLKHLGDGASSKTKYYTNLIRWYADNQMVFTPSEGVTITKVTIYASSSSYASVKVTPSTGTVNSGQENNTIVWTGNTTEALTLTADAQVRYSYVEVEYTKVASTDPVMVVNPTSWSVELELGETATREFTVTTENLDLAAVQCSLAGDENFVLTGENGAYTVTFNEAKSVVAGNYSATLTFSAENVENIVVEMSAVVKPASMKVTPTQLDFIAEVNTQSAAQTIKLETISIDETAITYSCDNDKFVVTKVNDTEYSVAFMSDVEGTFSGTLTFEGGEEVVTVALSGEAVAKLSLVEITTLAELSADDTYYMAIKDDDTYYMVSSSNKQNGTYFITVSGTSLLKQNATFTITPAPEGQYYIYFDGNYSGYVQTSTATTFNLNETQTAWNIEEVEGGFKISNGRVLSCNKSTDPERISTYTTSSNYPYTIIFYKEGASTPDPVTPTITADACDMGEVLVGEKATKALADIERVVENFSGDVVYTYLLAENDNFAIDGENLVFTAPAVAGVHEATLTITATYGEEVASVDVTVKATVLAPTITATDYDFGIVTVEKSKAISLSLLNVEVSNFSGEVEYTYELTASEYFTIEAVEGKTGNIVFNAPAEAGDYGTVLNITATCGVQTATTAINISGTAYSPITTPTGSGYVALTSVSEIDENKEYYMAAYFTATEKDDEGNIISATPMYAIINGVKEATDGYRFSTENSTELKVVDGTPTFAIKKSGDYYTIYDTKNGHYIYLDDEVDKNKLGMSSTISSPWSITYNGVAFEIGNVANNETNVGGGLAFNDQANYISWYTVIANEDYSYNIVLYTEGTAVVTDPYDGEQLGASKEEINRTNCITVTYEEGCEIANVDYSKITITQGNKSGVIVDQKEEEEATQAPRKAAAEAVVFTTEAAETDNASNNTFAFRPTYLMTVQDENGVDKEVEFNTLPAGYKYTIAMETGAVTFADDTQSSAYSWSFDMAIGTGVEDVTVAGALAYNGREVVAADSTAMIEVYNMSGVLVAAERGRANLNGLAGGVYVVRCGNDVLKVVR